MKLFTVICLLFNFAAFGQQTDTLQAWQSKYRNVNFKFKNPWTLVPLLDIKTQTFIGVIDNRDGKSYVIKVFDDLPKEQLSTEAYLADVKKLMLQPNSKNKVISEDSVSFHGYKAYRQTFLMYTDKWGILKQICHVIRTGQELITIQILFPTTEINANNEIVPEQINQFDKTVKINGF